MSDTPEQPDYRATVFLPKTDFPMKAGLAAKEPAILAKWAEQRLYRKLRETSAGRERCILHDGPPYANGDIHMGHAMNKVLKDIIVRSQSLLGKDAPYVPGWDCHGLPIEWKVEEAYRARKLNKDEVDPVQFRAECRAYAEKWVAVQRPQFERLGVQGDWDDPYLTMKYDAEAAIVGELLKFAESGQLYRGAKPVMWSPVEKTALAEAEVEYENIVSTQIDVAFEITEAPNAPNLIGAYAVVWTTTPWTIPVNQALAYEPEISYTVVHTSNARYVVAAQLAEVFVARTGLVVTGTSSAISHKPGDSISVFGDDGGTWMTFEGALLEGASARHPMHHLGGFYAKPRPFLPGEFVTTDTGTGLVHMSPDHGEDDFLLCKEHDIHPVFAVNGGGFYREDWLWLGGQGSVIAPKLNAPDGPICSDLRQAGALLAASQDYKHSYPHSWRSKAKLIFRCTPQWFIPMDKPLEPSPACGRGLGEGLLSSSSDEASLRSAPHPGPLPQTGEGETLRQTALAAIEETRWVPAKGHNRIHAMVEGRPDWVISRQRAWGVPIALYVHKKSGDYLRDTEVNARIVKAFKAGGADAWFTADHQALLGPNYVADDYEPQNDILDVWFDSGSTHAFVIEPRFGPNVRADLYLEGSDQHRGWFQSSLLESCGTRGRAPYKAVLTHGFALDGQGRKMSKSLGNVVDPLKIINESGADILRMWVASTDYFEDVRIGKEILSGTSDAYRKLRNSFRYLLGALDGYSEVERVTPAAMPELERYVLHLLTTLDAELKEAAESFELNRYIRALTEFANNDLSAFFFDIRKDSLYCDAPGDPKRRAYRTVLDTLFHALVRYAAPILCFTAEEVWSARYPDADSVHMLEWPEVDAGWRDEALWAKWQRLRAIRTAVTGAIEPLRREKFIGSSLEAEVTALFYDPADLPLLHSTDFAEIAIVSAFEPCPGDRAAAAELGQIPADSIEDVRIEVRKTENEKCGRCWRHLPEVTTEGALCTRCDEVVNG